MNKTDYFVELWAIKDNVREEVINMGRANNGGQYCREVIPQLKGLVPLNDCVALKLGEINPFTGDIKPIKPEEHSWRELYNFTITNEAVKNESETSKETDKE